MAGVEPIRSQESGGYHGPARRVQGSKALGPSSAAFPCYKHRAGREVEQLGTKVAPIQDSGVCKARIVH